MSQEHSFGAQNFEAGARKQEKISEGKERLNPNLERFFLRKLKEGRVGNLLKIILSDPQTRERFFQLHSDKMINIEDPELFHQSPERFSAVFVSLMRDKEMRQVLIDYIQQEQREQTSLHKRLLKEANKDFERNPSALSKESLAAMVYDEINIGGGVHSAIYNQAMTQRNLNVKNLTIESGKEMGGQFRTKDFVQINTSNTPHTEATPQPGLGRGDLNSMGSHAPVQLAYIEPRRFPKGSVFADLTIVNNFLSSTDVLLDSRLEKVVKKEEDTQSDLWPARYKVVLDDGTYVFTNRINKMTGLGESTLPSSFDKESKELFKQVSKEQKENEPPSLLSYEDYASFIHDPKNRHPYRPFANKTVIFVGSGDSTMTGIEFLLGLAESEAYKDDVTNVGRPKKIIIIGAKAMTAQKFKELQKTARYLQVTIEMPDVNLVEGSEKKKIEPVTGHLDQIRRNNDERGPFRFLVTETNTETGEKEFKEIYGDVGILATGYTDHTGKIFGYKEDQPFADPLTAEAVVGKPHDLNYQMVVGVKLKGEEIYALGPSALGRVSESMEEELIGNQKTAISQTTGTRVSIGTWSPRTEMMAERNADVAPRQVLPRVDFTQSLAEKMHRGEEDEKTIHSVNVSVDAIEAADLLTQVRIKTSVATILERFDFSDVKCKDLKIFITRDFVDSTDLTGQASLKLSLNIVFAPRLDRVQEDRIVRALIGSEVCKQSLSMIGRGRFKTLEISVPIKENGKIVIPDMEIQKRREPPSVDQV